MTKFQPATPATWESIKEAIAREEEAERINKEMERICAELDATRSPSMRKSLRMRLNELRHANAELQVRDMAA